MKRLRVLAIPLLCAAVFAAPPQIKTQAPGYFRTMIGDAEVTALYDGAVNMRAGVFHNLPAERVDALLAARFQDSNRFPTAINAYLVHTGTSLILIDAGSAKCFGPAAGKLPQALLASGYTPADIDTVLLTHMHGDHVCGLLADDGTPAFPRATVWASQAEADWWLNDANAQTVPANRRQMFKTAQAPLAPYRAAGRFRTFAGAGEVVPGIRAYPTPGHTPGHTSYLVTSRGDALLVLGDVVHAIAVQFAHPEVSYEYDTDQALAIASRRAIFARIIQHGWKIADAHLPFPGMGRLRLDGQTHIFVPIEFGDVPDGGSQ